MKNSLTRQVAERVSAQFPAEQHDEVLQALSLYGIDPMEPEVEAVHLAILTLADGDLDEVYDYVLYAKQDYADTLAWAESKHEVE